MNTNKKHKGMLSIELVVAVSVLATVIGVLVALGHSFAGPDGRHRGHRKTD
jgi:hypothetical protein